ncbi:c-type cytochrome [Arcobacter sp. LA11]|uniref:c-type cytochrome n=1 Tax=Arcobacter sp. LA11 TaxID=1898176 RepID=UPI00093322B3|nr:c-type cytochrome [Arcobacter sp. LA11]
MKKILCLTAIFACTLFADPYAKCVNCHGANGEKAAMSKSKVLKDMTKAEFIAAMKGYQDGSYGGAMKGLMTVQVKGLSDADIEAMANKIAK